MLGKHALVGLVVVGATVVGAAVVGKSVGTLVGDFVDGGDVGTRDGEAVVGATVVGAAVVGKSVGMLVGDFVEGADVGAREANVVGAAVVGQVSTAQKGPVAIGSLAYVHPERKKIEPWDMKGIVFLHGHKF